MIISVCICQSVGAADCLQSWLRSDSPLAEEGRGVDNG